MLHAGREIIKAEGSAALLKGAGANILRGVASAGVLSGYDKLQELVFGKGTVFPWSSSKTSS